MAAAGRGWGWGWGGRTGLSSHPRGSRTGGIRRVLQSASGGGEAGSDLLQLWPYRRILDPGAGKVRATGTTLSWAYSLLVLRLGFPEWKTGPGSSGKHLMNQAIWVLLGAR